MPESLRVLIVEDQSILAHALRDDVRAIGFIVLGPAPSERAALRILAERGLPDIGLLDYHLGDHTSEALYQRLRSEGIPALFLTGHTDLLAESGLAAAPSLTKPYDFDELRAALQRMSDG